MLLTERHGPQSRHRSWVVAGGQATPAGTVLVSGATCTGAPAGQWDDFQVPSLLNINVQWGKMKKGYTLWPLMVMEATLTVTLSDAAPEGEWRIDCVVWSVRGGSGALA